VGFVFGVESHVIQLKGISISQSHIKKRFGLLIDPFFVVQSFVQPYGTTAIIYSGFFSLAVGK
jgi:hypothetical protein